jgi:hypothetical protein
MYIQNVPLPTLARWPRIATLLVLPSTTASTVSVNLMTAPVGGKRGCGAIAAVTLQERVESRTSQICAAERGGPRTFVRNVPASECQVGLARVLLKLQPLCRVIAQLAPRRHSSTTSASGWCSFAQCRRRECRRRPSLRVASRMPGRRTLRRRAHQQHQSRVCDPH